VIIAALAALPGLFAVYLAAGILLDKAGEAQWAAIQRAWDATGVTVTGAYRAVELKEVLDRSQHLL
jgi:hypothetical protein